MSRPQSTCPAVLARTLLLGALPVSGCLWVSDAELAARLEREGGPGAAELTEEVVEGLLDTAEPEPDPEPEPKPNSPRQVGGELERPAETVTGFS